MVGDPLRDFKKLQMEERRERARKASGLTKEEIEKLHKKASGGNSVFSLKSILAAFSVIILLGAVIISAAFVYSLSSNEYRYAEGALVKSPPRIFFPVTEKIINDDEGKYFPDARFMAKGRVLSISPTETPEGSAEGFELMFPYTITIGWGEMSNQATIDDVSPNFTDSVFIGFSRSTSETDELKGSLQTLFVGCLGHEICEDVGRLTTGDVVSLRSYRVTAKNYDNVGYEMAKGGTMIHIDKLEVITERYSPISSGAFDVMKQNVEEIVGDFSQ